MQENIDKIGLFFLVGTLIILGAFAFIVALVIMHKSRMKKARQQYVSVLEICDKELTRIHDIIIQQNIDRDEFTDKYLHALLKLAEFVDTNKLVHLDDYPDYRNNLVEIYEKVTTEIGQLKGNETEVKKRFAEIRRYLEPANPL